MEKGSSELSPRSRGTISSFLGSVRRKPGGGEETTSTSSTTSAISPRKSPLESSSSSVPLPSPRKSPDVGRKTAEAAFPVLKEGSTVGKSGWLRKKMQKRFFVIVDEWIVWFKTEPKFDSTMKWTSAIQSTAKGWLFLSRCNVAKGEKPKEFVIVNPEGSNYVIGADSEEERDAWVRAIQKVVQVETVQNIGAAIEKRGTLKFRNIPKWFVLKEGVLMWFTSEHDATLEGSTTLLSATIALGQTLDGEPAFVIATLESKFVIGCSSRAEAEDWASLIKASINASKAKNLAKLQEEEANTFTNEQIPQFAGELCLMGADSRFFFILEGSVLQWYSEKTDLADLKAVKKNIRGYISLRQDMLVQALPPLPTNEGAFSFGFVLTSPGKSIAFLAQTKELQSEWVKKIRFSLTWLTDQSQKVAIKVKLEEKEGFLMRGKLKIWAVCKDASFMMYDSKASKKPITTHQLSNCGVLETKDKQGLMIFTSVPSLEILACIGRKAEAQSDNFEWFQAILLNIVRANAAAVAMENLEKNSKLEGQVNTIAFQQERLSGHGRIVSSFKPSDVFFSVRHSSIVWFKSEQNPVIKGILQLCGCQVDYREKEARVLIYGSDEKLALEFVVEDKGAHWGVALQEAIFDADEERGYKKFGFLETKGKRKWVVITRRHLMWFNAPMKISEIQNAGAFDGVQLAECDLTPFDACGFVLSERKKDSKVGEKVTAVSFLANSEAECQEWLRLLEQFVIQRVPKKHVERPYAALRLNQLQHGTIIQLDAFAFDPTFIEISRLPAEISLLQADSTPIDGVGTVVSSPLHLIALNGLASTVNDSFSFLCSNDSVMTENDARLLVEAKKPTVSLSSEGKKPLPTPPSQEATVVFWQLTKKELKHGTWCDVFDDEPTVSEEVLLAKFDLKQMIMGKNADSELVRALLSCLPSTEQDSTIQSVIAIFSSRGCALQLVERFIVAEIEASSSYETLFRTNSNATKMCKFFSVLSGASYLKMSLQAVVQRFMAERKDCEIDETKLQDPSKQQTNLKNLLEYSTLAIDAILDSLQHLPRAIRFICVVLWSNVERKFGDFKFAALGGFFFLRFLCPALITPDSHGLVASNAVSKELRRTLTLLTKVLQNISNGVEFGAKEEFMICMNPFIREQIPRVRQFFSEIVNVPPMTAFDCEEPTLLSGAALDRSVDTVYKQILFQQKKLISQPVFQKLKPLIDVIGIPEKLARTLEKQRATILVVEKK